MMNLDRPLSTGSASEFPSISGFWKTHVLFDFPYVIHSLLQSLRDPPLRLICFGAFWLLCTVMLCCTCVCYRMPSMLLHTIKFAICFLAFQYWKIANTTILLFKV